MESSKLMSWLQLGGILGVLAGLVLVGVQINQASELTRLQMNNEWQTNWLQQFHVMQGESPADVIAKATDTPGALTTAELFVLENYLNAYLDYWAGVKRISDEGLESEDRWRVHFDGANTDRDSYLTYIFGNHVSQAWWDEVTESGGWTSDREFFEAADAAIRQVDPEAMSAWQTRIRAKLADRIAQQSLGDQR